ncbi:MAG: hypothetical protein KA955_08240 [Prevotella sp.]|nr:hypothetical protein [Prevotella sp.]
MKKILLFILAIGLMIPLAAQTNSKALNKALKKEYQTKMKELKKGGWQLFASSRSLDVALLKHYQKLEDGGDNIQEIVSFATAKSLNVGHSMAINNACNTYATKAGSHVKGRVVSDMGGNADETSAEFDKFYAAYESLVEKEIRGELKESFSVIRTDSKTGNSQIQSYFLIDENAATQARIRAYENAYKESAAAQKYANKVSDFIKEGFKVDQNSEENK